MKVQYIREMQPTIAEIEAVTGRKVLDYVVGDVLVGTEIVEDEHNPGKTIELPITRRGIEIEFKDSVPAARLAALDAVMTKRQLKRRG